MPRPLIESRIHLYFAVQSNDLSSANPRAETQTMTLFHICTRVRRRSSKPLLFALSLASNQANAGLDHELGYDKGGPYSQPFQTGLEAGVIAVEVADALWLGNDDPHGHTFWQAVDSSSIAGLSSTALANRCHCRLGARYRRGILEYHARNSPLGANPTGRPFGWLLQEILSISG